MAKKKPTFKEIMELAGQYGVQDNVLFVSAANRYVGQMEMIEKIQKEIQNELIIELTGSTGAKKIETNPLVPQLPKYNDTANKTLSVMLDIIQKHGTTAPSGEKLGEFLKAADDDV